LEDQEEYVKKLEETIGRFLEPMKGIPFAVAIKGLSGFSVLPFDPALQSNDKLLKHLVDAAQFAGQKALQQGILTARPNEAGNHVEPFVLEALKKVGLKADIPITRSGKKKSQGYPDIQIEDELGRTAYLECKTYSTKTKRTGFRTFYFSPSRNPKITRDAFHLLLSFELGVADRSEKKVYIPLSWQIYTLDKLLVQIKHEFNANNKDLYTKEALLAQGLIST